MLIEGDICKGLNSGILTHLNLTGRAEFESGKPSIDKDTDFLYFCRC